MNLVALFSMLTAEADFVAFDPVSESLVFDDRFVLPIKLLRQQSSDDEANLEMIDAVNQDAWQV